MQRQVVRFPTYICSLVLNASYLSCPTMNGCRKSQEQKRQPYSNGGAAQATQGHPLDLRVQVLCPLSFLYILINVFLAEQKIRVIRCNSVFAYPKSDFYFIFLKHPIILKTQEFVNFNNRATQTTYMNKVKAGNKYLLMLN